MPAGEQMTRVQPRYARTPKANLYSAVFSAERRLSVEAGRARRYPGLATAAPDTRALYTMGMASLGARARVLDLGCGSGLGTAELAQRCEQVTAVDRDGTALSFVRQYLPHVEAHADMSGATNEPYDAVYVVDVLGQCEAPEQLLASARAVLAREGRLFIAEPRAYPAQALLPPVLRAYSPRALESTLVCAGFDLETWLDAGTFVACVARPSASDEALALGRAEGARAEGRLDAAAAELAGLLRCSRPELRAAALVASAGIALERGDAMSACQALLEALKIEPRHVIARARLAELSLFAGDSAEALSLAVSALEGDPCSPDAARALARAAEGASPADAFAAWRIANSLDPTDLGTAIELARGAASHGDLAFAIWVLERLRAFRADMGSEFHVVLAWLYSSAGRDGEARLEAELARVKEPGAEGVTELWAHLGSHAAPP